MVEIKHIQQINDGHNWKCGAVCLEMVFNYYKIPCNQDAIWNAVKSHRSGGKNQYFAFTHSLAEYAIKQGLDATIYKSDSETWPTVLEALDQLSMPAILSVKEKKTQQSHFMVFLGIKNKEYYFCDPNSPKEIVRFNYIQIREMWSPNTAIDVAGFIYVLFEGDKLFGRCPCCQEDFPLLTKNGIPFSTNIICPYCDEQMKIVQE